MSRTYRRLSTKLNLGVSLAHRTNQDGTVWDGTPTRYSKACENNGGCPYCEGNRNHSTNKRKPLEDRDMWPFNKRIKLTPDQRPIPACNDAKEHYSWVDTNWPCPTCASNERKYRERKDREECAELIAEKLAEKLLD